jgi:hypothetical protein
MRHTPDVIINKTAQSFRNALIGIGLFLALAGIAAFTNGGNGFWLLLLGGGALGIASKVKVRWEKGIEIGGYK